MRSGGLLTSSSWWQPQHASTDGEAAHTKRNGRSAGTRTAIPLRRRPPRQFAPTPSSAPLPSFYSPPASGRAAPASASLASTSSSCAGSTPVRQGTGSKPVKQRTGSATFLHWFSELTRSEIIRGMFLLLLRLQESVMTDVRLSSLTGGHAGHARWLNSHDQRLSGEKGGSLRPAGAHSRG